VKHTPNNVVALTMKARRKAASPAPKGPLNLQQSYNFVDKIEAIDLLRTWKEEAHMSLAELSRQSGGVCTITLKRWFDGKVRRPQLPTLNAVGRAFGKELKWVDIKK